MPLPTNLTNQDISKTDTIVRYDTINKDIIRNNPIISRDTIYAKLPQNIDTIYIINNYFTKYYYRDTITEDSIKIYINDTISQNQIHYRQVKYSILYPTNIITKFDKSPKLYAGFGINSYPNKIHSSDIKVIFKTPNEQLYGLGIGVDNNINLIISGQILWKIPK